ncbi:hypothetical protein [Streptococcus phage LF1]|nr:hypothetical protein [Streptococcus phage LF1]AYJ75069.1 hypothetical protein [Streptococcus phage LF4]
MARGLSPKLLLEPYLNLRGRFFFLGSFFIAVIMLAIPTNRVPIEVSKSAISDILISSSFLYIIIVHVLYKLNTFFKNIYLFLSITTEKFKIVYF